MGTQNIKAQVHLVETDEDNPTRVSMTRMPQKGKLVAHIAGGEFRRYLQMGYKPQHLYFTTDEEIKEGDWYIGGGKVNKANGKYGTLLTDRKIVATTNPELWDIKYKFQSEGANSFSHLLPDNGIPKIDTPFIEAYIKAYNEGNSIKEVLLEGDYQTAIRKDGCPFTKQPENGAYMAHDEHGWEILYKEYAVRFENFKLKLKSNGSVIIHPVKERIYTREEFRAAVRQAWIYSSGFVKFEEWFNKNYSE